MEVVDYSFDVLYLTEYFGST